MFIDFKLKQLIFSTKCALVNIVNNEIARIWNSSYY